MVRQVVAPLKGHNIDTVVLGCTHFPLLVGPIRHELGPNIRVVSSAEETTRELVDILQRREQLAPEDALPQHRFATTSDNLAEFAAAAPDDLLILGVDYNDPQPEAALTFASDSKWTWAHVVDPEKKLAGPLQLSGIPTTLFVTSDGVIAYRHVGDFTSTKEIAEFSQQYLGIA